MAALKFEQVFDAVELSSFGSPGEVTMSMNRETGEAWLVVAGPYADPVEELPEDIDSDRYIVVPGKHDLDLELGRKLVREFAEQYLAGDVRTIDNMSGRRGAYGRFKGFLDDRNLLQTWYEFESAATREGLRAWCVENGIELESVKCRVLNHPGSI